ncbi:Ig-like domain-containing protein [Siminovitchia fortis]|uniref:Ig-like domain-containing protein n=3 Tax=Bacillales TaxID=1385 RepID=UPI00119E8663|nr:Ig-like domain-containing protein [Siminovitchia fortis]
MRHIKRALICILIILLSAPASAFAETEIEVDSNPSMQGEPAANVLNQSAKNYMLISNESVNPNSRQSTGTPVINNEKYRLEKNVRPEAFRMDVNLPFDAEKFEDRKLHGRSLMYKSLIKVGETRNFNVFDFDKFIEYKIQARLLYTGKKVNVWGYDKNFTKEHAKKLGNEFDEKIYPAVTENFGPESDVDGDGKIDILCYDIKDGFKYSGGYIAGYFYARDLYDAPGSNRSEVFYIDTYPTMGLGSKKDVTGAYSTLAHEFQHMVNFNQNVLVEGGKEMDPWLDEGLSMAAEQIYTGSVLKDRIDYYNSSYSVTNGHSLLYWDDDGDVLANYSLSYLFMQYVKAQSKQGDAIFKEIIRDKSNNYKAVEKAAKKYIDPKLTFGTLMTNFRGALLLKEKSGKYGFNSEPGFNTIRPRIYKGSSANLRGGGAVVKEATGKETIPTSKGKNIKYTFFGPGEPRDHTAPARPVVQKVSDRDTVVKGTAEAGAAVYVKAGTASLGKAVSDSKKSFSVAIKKQKAGTKLQVYAVDKAGNKSDAVAVTVIDKTPPAMPTVSKVSNRDLKVSGKAEAGSKITVTAGGKVIGSGMADKAGKYAVNLKARRKAGTALYVKAADKAGNVSKERKVIVVDKIPPKVPEVNKVTNKTTAVKGKTEKGATVSVKSGKKVLGTAKANDKGSFTVKVKKQRVGTLLEIYAKDQAGNTSKAAKVTVKKT